MLAQFLLSNISSSYDCLIFRINQGIRYIMKTKLTLLALIGLLLSSGATYAQWSANVGVTNNYLWRGLTQSINEPAVQGGIDYASDSGFYVGTWASNVSYDSDDAYSYEHDVYFGWGGESGGITYDFSKFVAGLNCEKVVGGLRSQGTSTRMGGSPLILELRNFGMPTTQSVPSVGGDVQNHVRSMSGVLMICVFSIDVICRAGSVEVRE